MYDAVDPLAGAQRVSCIADAAARKFDVESRERTWRTCRADQRANRMPLGNQAAHDIIAD
jgi:hypothetical protein